ncbi:hypothetical protein J6590_007206 [Homalodisca vitripennis]|nr:hypothetical protein J6590_007206 [Homalodisca vitripennis]
MAQRAEAVCFMRKFTVIPGVSLQPPRLNVPTLEALRERIQGNFPKTHCQAILYIFLKDLDYRRRVDVFATLVSEGCDVSRRGEGRNTYIFANMDCTVTAYHHRSLPLA